jgi:hypothetical protein
VLYPSFIDCNYTQRLLDANASGIVNLTKKHSVVQRFSGKPLYGGDLGNMTAQNRSNEYGVTVVTSFNIVCDLYDNGYLQLPRFTHLIGHIIGFLLLGLVSDLGGRKVIVLACIWTCGVMSMFQLVGDDFVSYVFFQLFVAIFIGVSSCIDES